MSPRASLRLLIGSGGALLIGSLFMEWAHDRNGWELLGATDVFLVIAGGIAVAAALTGGRVGLFRPDVSLNGAADVLSGIAAILIAWLAIFDFPDGAGREVGLFVALAAALTIAGAVGDYRVLRGAPLFPRLD